MSQLSRLVIPNRFVDFFARVDYKRTLTDNGFSLADPPGVVESAGASVHSGNGPNVATQMLVAG